MQKRRGLQGEEGEREGRYRRGKGQNRKVRGFALEGRTVQCSVHCTLYSVHIVRTLLWSYIL